ncbi:MAG TPA: hypothetical protein PKK39_08265 [Tepidiformaceae bacterium]|nr:hypothetical protein [Tepidiformaceae bacterium]
MRITPSQPRPAWLQSAVTLLALALLVGIYVAVMHGLVDFSKVDGKHEASERDLVYVYIHVGLFLAAGVIGFVAGKWFSGLGFAFAVLFLVITMLLTTAIQLSSYEMACRGHNDLVRHWQC